MGELRAVGLIPKTRECVWLIRCVCLVISLMGMLNDKDKLFHK